MNRRGIVIVSLVAVMILGGIAAGLALANDDETDQDGAEPVPATGPSFDGVTFTDPQGTYRLDIDPDWTEAPGGADAEVESWAIGSGPASSDRVDVTTTDVGELDLDQYMQLVIERVREEVEHFKLREFRVVSVEPLTPTTAPEQLGVIAYEGTRAGAPVAYLLVMSVRSGTAVVATLTTRPDTFAAARAAVEPYLMTLESIGT